MLVQKYFFVNERDYWTEQRRDFEEVSGLKVNFHKSILTDVNVSESRLSEAALVMNCQKGVIPFVYLGLPIGGDSRKISFWKPVLDRIVAHLSSWSNNFLSYGGRLVLLKSVLSSLPVYFLSFFRAPAGHIKEGDMRGSHWWRMVCRVRDGVGEGVGSWFEENLRWVVGNGRNMLCWFDCWVGDMPLRLKYPRLFDLTVWKECSVEEMWRLGWIEGGRVWVWRRRLLAWEEDSVRECSLLLHNVVLQENVTDTWRWLMDPSHGYSVRESYKFFSHSSTNVDRSLVDDV
ncbi:hypothetical protein MTR_3g093740 [Medicago truncatula]|uniref:Reverse transcriptase zinc-binding domain-containing protein n=1 Tax=Medicago truncatula TaxID=3880 RepID=A0A072V1F1_MEDTR|nr:hypothetical protein MTR_3g093740 [Medicago truncatula]